MKKFLFWSVAVIWLALTVGIYATGFSNSWPFHNKSLITYTTTGMTNEQSSNFYKYIMSLGKDSNGNYNYDLPTFTPDLNNPPLLDLDDGNNTYTIQLQIPNYQQYGLSIKSRGQSEGTMFLIGLIGAVLLVGGGFFVIITLYWYAYDPKEFNFVWRNGEKP